MTLRAGDGRVVPLSRLQTIQSLEGGILAKLMVHEGDLVQPGQVLVKMDPTQARSDYLQSKSEMDVLEAEGRAFAGRGSGKARNRLYQAAERD